MTKTMGALLALLVAGACAPASAALYRCGNSFQDRPCDSAAQQQLIRPARGAAKALAPSAPAAPATARGTTPRAAAAPEAAPAPTAVPVPAEATTAVAAPASPAPAGGVNAACGTLREQRNALDGRLRIGGSPATTEMLQRQRREVDRNLASSGC